MSIKIKSSADLEKLLDALATDIIRSIHYRELLLSISAEVKNFPDVFAQSNTFWNHTQRALSDSAISSLCRVYDTQPRALSLPNLLKLISVNIHYFSDENFRSRLQGNPFVDSLSEYPRTPDPKQLKADVSDVSTKNELVNRLIIWRNNLYGHRSAPSTLESFKNLDSHQITWAEIQQLSERALTIYNRYQSLFKANTWSTMHIGKDDFISLLRFAQSGLNQQRKNLDNEIASFVTDSPPAHA